MTNPIGKVESQIDKFRETARELECDESEEAFERKLKKVTRPQSEDDASEAK